MQRLVKSRPAVVVGMFVAATLTLCSGVALAVWSSTSSTSISSPTDALSTPTIGAVSGQTTSGATINWSDPGTWQSAATYTATATASGHTTKSCSALASALSCALTGLDAATTYSVSVSGQLDNWVSSAATTTATTTSADTTAPTSTVTFPASAGTYNAAGWTAGCNVSPFSATDTICGTASDNVGGSGMKSVAVSVQATSGTNSGKYWDPASPAGFKNASEVKMTATLSSGNWTLAFPAANLSDAAYTVRVYATDNANNTQASATIASFTYDTTAPTGSITSPANNATNLSGTQTVTATAADTGGSGVASVQFQYKTSSASTYTNIGAAVTGSSPYSASWVLQGLPNGSYNLRAVVTDNAGNATTTSAITVSVSQAASVTPGTADVGGGGALPGKINAGDKIVMNFPSNHQPTLSTACSTWTSSSQPTITNATVTFTDGVGTTNDSLSSVTSSTCTLNLGTFDLGSNAYLQDGTGNGTLVFNNSTIAWSGSAKTITITLGTVVTGGSTTQTVASSVVTWTPSPSLQDANTTSFDYAQTASGTAARQF